MVPGTFVKQWGENNDTQMIMDNVGLADLISRGRAEAEARHGHDLVLFWTPPTAHEDRVIDHREIYEECERRYGKVCGAIGVTALVQHSGRGAAAPPAAIERLHRVEREALRALGDVGARHGVKLPVETLWVFDRGQYTATADRLAEELRRVDHPFACGTLDFSHVYLYSIFLGLDFRAQVESFAPVAGHLHVHDSFGRPKLTPMYAPSEELAFGLGDLHLPLGWGDIPWDDMLPKVAFQDDTAFIVELPPQFAEEAPAVAAEARRLIGLAGSGR